MNIRRSAAVCCLLVLGTACMGGTGARVAAPPNRIVGQNLRVDRGDALRFGFAPSEPFAHALVTFTPANAGVMVCPLTALTSPLPPATSCRTDVGSGVRESVTVTRLAGLAIVATRAEVTLEVVIEFEGASRAIGISLPRVSPVAGPASCDVDCAPLFEVTPARDGAFRARATWTGSSATLLVLQGRILARSATATGVPYREVARADGTSSGSVTATFSSTGEYALLLRGGGIGALSAVRIDATWP